nr:trichodiene oxygenase [Quercus suber]
MARLAERDVFDIHRNISPWRLPCALCLRSRDLSMFVLLVRNLVVGAGLLITSASLIVRFHPLASIPGPKIAALDVTGQAQLFVSTLGKCTSTTPNLSILYFLARQERRINTSLLADEQAVSTFGTNRLGKERSLISCQAQNSIVATIDHDLHRQRRNTINGFFSSASIRRLEPIMKQSMSSLLRRLEEAGKEQEILPMHYVLKACTSDVITKFAFGDSFHFMDEQDYAIPYMKATDVYHLFNHAFCHFPILGQIIGQAPLWAIKLFIPALTDMWNKRGMWLEQVHSIKKSSNPERVKTTIFEGILSSRLAEEEKTDARLAHEAQLVVFAGQAYTLSAAIYELLATPSVLKKTKEELAIAIPDVNEIPSFNKLDVLPYFSAVVQEVLRIHPGIVSRLPRVSPIEPIVYRSKLNDTTYVLPPGTPYNMTIQIAHMNPEAFEDPYIFRPERWIENPKINKGFIGFARGTRNCVGSVSSSRSTCVY